MAIPRDDKSNRYGFHSAPITEKEVINVELVIKHVVSRVSKLLDSTSKASSLNPDNVDNKAAVDTLKACITACNVALKTPSDDLDKSVTESSESRHSFTR